jgi:hypothetical protein
MITRFPRIEHLDDVKKYIDPAYFLLCQKEGYQVIDYFLSAPDTFPPITEMGGMLWCGGNIEAMEKEWAEWLNATSRREFRGIIFDMADHGTNSSISMRSKKR